jgi:metal-responsive CopG/Arc/MetJ family transcriptional regulator
MTPRTAKRGAHRKEDCVFVGAWVPKQLMLLVDEFVAKEDTDRSKLIRRAIEEKLTNKAA